VGFQDRYYNQQQQPFGPGGGRPGMTQMFGLPPMSPVIKYLLIANGVIYVLQMIFPVDPFTFAQQPRTLEYWFAAVGYPWTKALQIWRLLSFQFLHGGFWHLFGNMLGLYFFGSALERIWGSKKFLVFYLSCGALGGLLYVLASATGIMEARYLIGASGGVLGIMAACAVLFPQMKVFIFPIPLPIPIRVLIFFITIGFVINVFRQGPNAGGDVCHLGGMALGFVWVMSRGRFGQIWLKLQNGSYKRKMEQQQKLQYEVDRILAKVHEQGVQSLTRKEKQILQQATEQQKNHMSGF